MWARITAYLLYAIVMMIFFSLTCISCSDETDTSVSVYFPSQNSTISQHINDEPSEKHDLEDPEESAPLIRKTIYGELKGIETDNNTYAWLGIPFAQPPVGDFRWRAPQPPEPWDGVRSAESFCSYCPQYGNLISETGEETFGKLTGNEDCLYLNIWRPATKETQLPVFIFIYGGGNYVGRSDLSLYNGSTFAAKSNIILITLNYRLGILGWFSHPELYNGDPLDDSGNYGTLDIIEALEWVQDNIQSFGGDPDNITIAGQSSGAINVYAMMTSPLASGLFHKAIAMSGFPISCTQDFAETRSENILNRLLQQNNQTIVNGAVFNADGTIASHSIASYLKSQTLDALFNPEYAMFTGLPKDGGILSTLLRMGITVDGHVIPKKMLESLETEQYNKVPLIVGNTTEEVKLFLPLILVGDNALYNMFDTFDPDNPDLCALDVLKPRLWPMLSVYKPMTKLIKRLFQNLGVDKTANTLSQYQDVYVYQFGWNDQPKPFGFYIGAGHAVDVPFALGNFITDQYSLMNFAWSEENKQDREKLSHDMMTYYAQFARTGNPNVEDDELMDWPAWDNGSKRHSRMIFDTSGGYVSDAYTSPEVTQDIEATMESLADLIANFLTMND